MNTKEAADMAVMKRELQSLNTKLDQHSTEQREDLRLLMERIDCMHNHYAGKWVEKVSIGLLIAIISGVVTILLQIKGGI